MNIEIKNISAKVDQKGSIAELLTSADIKKHNNLFGHLFFVTFKNNQSIRGNHYHQKTHEYYILLSGKIRVMLFDVKSKKKKSITLLSNSNITSWLRIGPNIAHACHSLSPKTVMLGYFSKAYNRGTDTVNHMLIKELKK